MKAAARQRHRVHSNALAVKMQVDSTEASTEWFRKIADARRGPGGHFAPADLEARPRTSVHARAPTCFSRRTSITSSGVVLSKASGRSAVRTCLGGQGIRAVHAGGRCRGQALGLESRVDDVDMRQLTELEEEAVIVDGMLLTLLRNTVCRKQFQALQLLH
ncbi:hypothetical protein ON010_g16459 [Phytophthora cinnamomi]|nr:hypothetical protein ON010_g16459 [Phytophthora cinnamomi]